MKFPSESLDSASPSKPCLTVSRYTALIEQVGARLVYLPPYSPDFSLIENCWSKIKSVLRSIGARTYPDLAQAIKDAFEQVSLKDIRN